MIRDIWAQTAWISRALVAMTAAATMASGSATLAAEPSPLPSASVTAGLCPAGHVVATMQAEPNATATAAALMKGPPPSDGVPKPPMLEAMPTDIALGGVWSELSDSPFAAMNAVAVWAGDQLVTIDHVSGRTATYDPSIHRWEEHQPIPGESDPQRGAGWTFDGAPRAVWTGSEVIVSGSHTGPDGSWRVWYAFDPVTGRWRDAAPSPLISPHAGHLAWTGDLLLVVSGRAAAAYDPAADCWLEMPEVPLPELPANAMALRADDWAVRSIHWTGDKLLAVVMRVAADGSAGIVSFDPSSWEWAPGALGPIDGDLVDPVLADGKLWFLTEDPEDPEDTRGELATNATYDPATDTWAPLDTECRINTRWATWTGQLIMEPYRDRRAFDPETGACYRTPASKDRARQWKPVWTGREFLYWSGAYGDADVAYPDGIVYRPPRRAISDEPVKPIGKKLRHAMEARRKWGFDTDPAVVRAIGRGPYQPDSRQYGFPMTEAEAQDLLARSGWSGRAAAIRSWLGKQEGFGGIWIDQRAGGAIAIAFTEADDAIIREIDRRFAPFDGPTPWKLVIVPRSYDELRDAFRRVGRVSRAIDPDAMLWSVGLDESGGLISLLYDPDDVKRMRSKKTALEQRLGVPVRITGGRVRDT